MKFSIVSRAVAMVAAWMIGLGVAHADTVLLNEAGFIKGQQSFVQSFDITTPGTLTITLTDIPWLDTLSGLSGFVSSSSGVMGGMFTDGKEIMNVNPGMLYAHWFGDANGAYGVGVYGIKVSFQPNGTVVPLPGTLVLLLSALALLYVYPVRLPTRRSAQSYPA